LSFTDHLQELRVRIIICLVFFAFSFAGGFLVAPRVIEILVKPLVSVPRPPEEQTLQLVLHADGNVTWQVPKNLDTGTSTPLLLSTDHVRVHLPDGTDLIMGRKDRTSLFYLSPLEPFFLYVQGALLVSGIFCIPMLVYQLWLFVSPGLVRRERRIVSPLLLASIVLFPMGAGFAYVMSYVALPVLLSFGDGIAGLEPNLAAARSMGLVITMMLISGLLFEFPLVLVLLARLGIVSSHFLVERRKVAIVILAVVSAVATPSPDPFSMLLLLAPLIALYEGSVWAIRAIEKSQMTPEQEADGKTT